MWKQKLCLATSSQFKISEVEQIKLFKQVGFDGFFTMYEKGKNFEELVNVAKELDMFFQSIHAPFEGMKDIWLPGNKGIETREELLDCIHVAAKYKVPIVVMHAFIGFEDHSPSELGLKNLEIVVEEAKKLNVKIAFENTEGIEYLKAIMEHFRNEKHIGFCWDTGHEMCYNYSQRMLDLYGNRLFCTHLNDNLGIKDFQGKITWIDDLHLLPFDGVANWDDIALQLSKHKFHSELTFELNTMSKPNRHENDVYERMELIQYLTLAYARACKVANLKLKKDENNV